MGLFDGTPLERPVRSDGGGPEGGARSQVTDAAVPAGVAPSDQSPRVRRERRRGKWCTVVAGIEADAAGLKRLLGELRKGVATGGGVSDGELVLQGDHRDAIVTRLVAMGYRAKAAGG